MLKYDEEMLCCCPKSIFTPNSPWFTHIDPAAWWLTLVHQGFTLKYSTTFHNISSSFNHVMREGNLIGGVGVLV